MHINDALSAGLRQNIDNIRELSGGSSDILINRFRAGGIECALICCDGMLSSQALSEMVLTPLTDITVQESAACLFSYIRRYALLSPDQPTAADYRTLFRLLHSGFAALIAEGMDYALTFGIQGYSTRGIQEPSGEGSVMGSHEGLTENLRTNMSMLRRRLKTPELVMEMTCKGSMSSTDLCICYMKDRVPERLLKDIRRSLGSMDPECVLTTGYILPFLERRRFELFNSAGTTERPDVLCSRLTEGRVALLTDGIPYAVTVPHLFCESFQTLDDYAYKPFFATFIRWLKYAAFLAAVLLPAVYLAIVMYHPELLNSTLLELLAKAEREAPLSVVTEAFFALLMYEIIREAGVRLPKPAGGAVSIISGLIIGDAAVHSGLISTPLLTVTALSVLGGMVIPELNPQITILRIVFLVSGSLLGLFGISLAACAVLTNICATETYGFPYTAPFAPFYPAGMGDSAVRTGMKKMLSRGFTVEEYNEQDK